MSSVILVHGWGGSYESTWRSTGFTALLEDEGLTPIGVDLLGHGNAPKPHDPSDYADMTERVLDALPDEPAAAIGFSLGAMTLLRAAIDHPGRFSRIVLAGIGDGLLHPNPTSQVGEIVAGLELARSGGDLGEVSHAARVFVNYAQQPGNDIDALIAVMRRPAGEPITADDLARVTCPVLVAVGDADFSHPGDQLAAAFADGRAVTLRRTDHFATPKSFDFIDATLNFLTDSPR